MKHLIAIAILATSLAANAQFKDGNKLYGQITSTDVNDKIIALGYVTGVVDLAYGTLICPPANSTATQMVDMVKKFLTDNPDMRHHVGSDIVVGVLGTPWPCAKQKKKGVEL